MKKNILLVACILMCFAIILCEVNKKPASVFKVNAENEAIVKSLDMTISFIKTNHPTEFEYWGFAEGDDLDNLTIGEGIPVYWLGEGYTYTLERFKERVFYPIFSGQDMRTGIIMNGKEFSTTTGCSDYLADYLKVYEREKEINSSISDYYILDLAMNYLLVFELDGEAYLIGNLNSFGFADPICKFTDFVERLKEYNRTIAETYQLN